MAQERNVFDVPESNTEISEMLDPPSPKSDRYCPICGAVLVHAVTDYHCATHGWLRDILQQL